MYDIAVNMFIYTLINSVNSSLLPQCVCLVCKKPFYKTVFNTSQMKPDISTLILYLPLHLLFGTQNPISPHLPTISVSVKQRSYPAGAGGRLLLTNRTAGGFGSFIGHISAQKSVCILEFKQKYFCIFFLLLNCIFVHELIFNVSSRNT